MTDLAQLDLQRERAAKNQSLFREVNERIEDRADTATFIEFICECADRNCSELVSLTREEYEEIRAASNTFLLIAGHSVPEVEEMVEATDRYVVVAKVGAGRAVAERLDPRKRVAR
jgi:hypothetical protein